MNDKKDNMLPKLLISGQDKELVREAKADGVLVDVDGHRLRSKETFIVACSDGRQVYDQIAQHCRSCACSQHHAFMVNGGPLSLSPHSYLPGADLARRLCVMNLEYVVRHLGIKTVAFQTHVPCGMAYGSELDFVAVLQLLLEGKLYFREQSAFAELNMAMFVHVDHDGDKKRTLFVKREQSIRFLEKHGRAVRY